MKENWEKKKIQNENKLHAKCECRIEKFDENNNKWEKSVRAHFTQQRNPIASTYTLHTFTFPVVFLHTQFTRRRVHSTEWMQANGEMAQKKKSENLGAQISHTPMTICFISSVFLLFPLCLVCVYLCFYVRYVQAKPSSSFAWKINMSLKPV